MTGPMIGRCNSYSDEIKITYKCPFSSGWEQNFKDYHGIRELNISGEVLCTDDEAAEQYNELFYSLVEQHKLFPTQIYSADETRLFGSVCQTAFQLVQVKSMLKVSNYIKTE